MMLVHILSRVVSEKYAVFNNSDRGPSFGRCVLGKGDLILMGEIATVIVFV